MDEREWLACNDPQAMLGFLKDSPSDRKLRLFACACCRRVWDLLVHAISQHAVEVAERFADGLATDDEQYDAYQAAEDVRGLLPHAFEESLLEEDPTFADAITRAGIPRYAAEEAAEAPVAAVEEFGEEGAVAGAYLSAATAVAWANASGDEPDAESEESEFAAQAWLLRDLVGNPFRPVVLDPGLRTPAVLALAQSAYEHRTLPAGTLEPDRLAVLADALEEAGCTEADILGHLRGPGPHVRGCFGVDLILDKK